MSWIFWSWMGCALQGSALEVQNQALQAELEQLEATNAQLVAELALLQQRQQQLEEQLSPGEAPAGASGSQDPTPGDPPPAETSTARCVERGGVLTLQGEPVPEDLSRSLRALPHRGRGDTFDGFKLMGIRSGSLADSCGIRNGDIVHSANGRPLTSVSEVMEATAALQSATTLSLQLTRQGQPMTLELALP